MYKLIILLVLFYYHSVSGKLVSLKITDAPYQVAILDYTITHIYPERSPLFLCEGTILSESHVITYSKCGHHQMVQKMMVRAGSSDPFEGGSLHDVINFEAFSYSALIVSPAIVHVYPCFHFDKMRQPIKLPRWNTEEDSAVHLITFYKENIDKKIESILRRNDGQAVSPDICMKTASWNERKLKGSPLCIENLEFKPLSYATGALAVKDDTLIGICRGILQSRFAIFVNVYHFIDWITYHIET